MCQEMREVRAEHHLRQ